MPRRPVVLAEDETHLNLLPHVRASWTLRGMRPEVLTPGTNRKVTVLGAVDVTTGAWVYRLGRCCAAASSPRQPRYSGRSPRPPAIVVICDHDSIHHARKVTAYLEKHPQLAWHRWRGRTHARHGAHAHASAEEAAANADVPGGWSKRQERPPQPHRRAGIRG